MLTFFEYFSQGAPGVGDVIELQPDEEGQFNNNELRKLNSHDNVQEFDENDGGKIDSTALSSMAKENSTLPSLGTFNDKILDRADDDSKIWGMIGAEDAKSEYVGK